MFTPMLAVSSESAVLARWQGVVLHFMPVHITHHDHASMRQISRLDTTLASSWVSHSATASTGWASRGSELWSCDLADGRWSTHWDTDGWDAPVATRGASAVLSPSTSTVYVFGGEYGTGAVSV